MYSFLRKNIVPISILSLIFIGLVINALLKSKQCFQSSYYLVIDKINIGSKNECTLYSNGKKINLMPYTVTTHTGIKIGDSISKDYCARYVYFYRKDSFGNYYEFEKLEPISIFSPRNWFCDNK